MLAKNYTGTTGVSDNEIAKQFVDFIKAVAKRHAQLDGQLQGAAVMTGDALANVYGNWPYLSLDARDFYSQLINLIDNTGKNQPATSVPYEGKNMSDFRLNLKKVNLDI